MHTVCQAGVPHRVSLTVRTRCFGQDHERERRRQAPPEVAFAERQLYQVRSNLQQAAAGRRRRQPWRRLRRRHSRL